MKEILFLTYHLPTPERSGAGRPWAEATMLKELGYNVTVLTAGTDYLTGLSTMRREARLWDEESRDGIRIVKLFTLTGHRKSTIRRLLHYIVFSLMALIRGVRGKADFVFMGTDPLFIVPVGFVLALLHRARLVLDERDLFPDTFVILGYMRPGFTYRCLDAWSNFVRRRAHHIVSATPGIKRLLLEKDLSADKITVMVNAFPPEPGDHLTLPEHAIGTFTVFYGGGMGMGNELSNIVRAAKLLQDESLPIRFLFVGEGDLKAEYIDYCRQQGIGNCCFMPSIARTEIPLLLAKVDICIHSLKADPFLRCALSSKILDYLAYGRPVAFAGEGDIADLLEASNGGLSVPPEQPRELAEAIRYLYENPELRLRMGESAREYVKAHFSRSALRAHLSKAFIEPS